MRPLRVPLGGAVILLLAISLSVAVAAQDEADPMAPAYFTFQTESSGAFDEGQVTAVDGTTTEIRGGIWVDQPVEATDPRASGLMTYVDNADTFTFGDSAATTVTSSVRLVNDGGTWSGTGLSMVAFTSEMALSDEVPRTTGLIVLTGAGGYQGLTLIMSAPDDFDNAANWGVIIPTGGMPPVPDPMEPPAE